MKKVTAKFTGRTSLGFVTGRYYTLEIRTFDKNNDILITDELRSCTYSNILTFLNNWNCIRVIN